MKKQNALFSNKFFIFTLLFVISISNLFSQEITEGTEYWFGIPYSKMKEFEFIRNGTYPIVIWISSKVDTKATLSEFQTGWQKTYSDQSKSNNSSAYR